MLPQDDGEAAAEHPDATEPPQDRRALGVLHGLVELLPTALRSSLTLYYFEERSVEEVASMLGIPQGTVKTHLHRARIALHQRLEEKKLAHADLWL
jgi:RNA polymerase sigma-70 factor (ECF subfamily)